MHSLIRAEKSAGMREEYNSRRQAGVAALKQLGFASFQQALDSQAPDPQAPDPQALEQAIAARVLRLPDLPQRCFRHVVTEAARVSQAMRLMRERDLERFGDLLTQSHASLRDDLRVSCPELDQVVQYALRSGAVGARLTGAGFGGYAVALVAEEREAAFLEAMAAFYEHLPQRHDFPGYLMKVTASDGALRY
jgi:galactokinase